MPADEFSTEREELYHLLVIRQYASLGIQLTITLIDSDLPPHGAESEPVFEQSEIVLTRPTKAKTTVCSKRPRGEREAI